MLFTLLRVNFQFFSVCDCCVCSILPVLFLRVKESIGLVIDGLDSVGGLLSGYVRASPKAFVPLFCDKSPLLTIQTMKSLYVIKWSEEGSNQREAEESTIFCWEQFLL